MFTFDTRFNYDSVCIQVKVVKIDKEKENKQKNANGTTQTIVYT